ncbi:MAG: GMP reductase [Balneola sp.]|nr:GMP reductase [Balneola sp.]|tara:strand:+ start:4237 stop:5286 length:1050 start_codon:yes stop_codon:yes gene_type:complete
MNKIEADTKLDFSNVLIRPKRSTVSSRSEVDLEREFKFVNRQGGASWKGVPVIAANMDTTGTFSVYETLSKYKIITALHKFYRLGDFQEYLQNNPLDPDLFMVSTGISDANFNNLTTILDNIDCNWICVDIANGYISKLVEFCRKVRAKYPDKIIVAGNVVTREIVEELILTGGVDVVKVGIGPGSACLTRKQTGVGMPQLSAIIECADAAHGVGGHIIGDGGITCPGDMAKAFGGGADFVMMGGQFAGHDENPGDIIEKSDGNKYKLFYGMSSQHAMEKHFGKMDSYRSSEGRKIEVKYKGPLKDTVEDYLGGLRSTCTYINAKGMKQMAKCTTFLRVTQQLNTTLQS